jgi:hypothetical protein
VSATCPLLVRFLSDTPCKLLIIKRIGCPLLVPLLSATCPLLDERSCINFLVLFLVQPQREAQADILRCVSNKLIACSGVCGILLVPLPFKVHLYMMSSRFIDRDIRASSIVKGPFLGNKATICLSIGIQLPLFIPPP